MAKHISKRNLLLSGIIFILIWQAASMVSPPVIIPAPYVVLRTLVLYLFDPAFYKDLGLTVFRGLTGYVISMFLGIVIAFVIHYHSFLKSIIYPYLTALQMIPRISWILLAMIWFPLNSIIVIFIIIITVIPIITVNTLEGLENIDYSLIEMSKVFEIKKRLVIKDILIPSITTNVFSGLNVSLGITWKTVVMAELLTVPTGLGAQMSYAKTSLATDHILALTICIIIIGLLFQGLLSCLRMHYERWKIDE